jgi:hypothetical protein
MYFLRTYDTIYDEGQEPLGCELVAKLERDGREHWLLNTSQPFPHFPVAYPGPIARHKGPHGERVASDFVLVVPRHAGFTFETIPSDGLHVHLCVPKSDAYPPDTQGLDMSRYVHLYWGLLYSSLADAERSPK